MIHPNMEIVIIFKNVTTILNMRRKEEDNIALFGGASFLM
jgi:hypothetical protein